MFHAKLILFIVTERRIVMTIKLQVPDVSQTLVVGRGLLERRSPLRLGLSYCRLKHLACLQMQFACSFPK